MAPTISGCSWMSCEIAFCALPCLLGHALPCLGVARAGRAASDIEGRDRAYRACADRVLSPCHSPRPRRGRQRRSLRHRRRITPRRPSRRRSEHDHGRWPSRSNAVEVACSALSRAPAKALRAQSAAACVESRIAPATSAVVSRAKSSNRWSSDFPRLVRWNYPARWTANGRAPRGRAAARP